MMFAVVCALVSTASLISYAASRDWPEKQISVIVPWAAGGAADLMSRAIAPYWGSELGAKMVVENYEGAGGQVGITKLANSNDDGYAISAMMQPHMSLTIYTQNAPYKLSDFSVINMQQIDPVIITVLKKSPYTNIKDFVEDAKARPGEIAVGVNLNSGAQAMLYWMMDNLGIDITIVPYSGGGEGRAALMGGHVDVYCGYVSSDYALREFCKALGVFWDDTDMSEELWPGVPTMSEQLGIKVPAMASYRGFIVAKSFKEKYPERWEKLVETYSKAFDNSEHQKNLKDTGVLSISTKLDPEASDKLMMEVDTIIEAYKGYFK
jgi:tripartite-type tricarboxylate transporter receptor subunit TctC